MAACRELELRHDYLCGEKISTIYIGGGTPSQLTVEDPALLLAAARLQAKHADEVTVECNPDDIDARLAHALIDMGVNRVSMGIQTFDENRLALLHRRHSAEQAIRAVDTLHNAGFENISIDLISGFPGQTIEEWNTDLDKALSLNVPHISSYSLMYEEGTPLFRELKEGRIHELDEETSIRMYDLMCDRLESVGYEHYEISNFAKSGFRSRHNSSYWDGTPYLGVGAGAHSYNRISRQWNITDINSYLSSVSSDRIPFECEYLDNTTQVNDMITTALRTCDGLDMDKITIYYGKSYSEQILKSAKPHLDGGLLRLNGSQLILTRQGIHLSDLVMSDLIII